MQLLKVKNVLEIGCYDGGTACGFLELGCTVHSVDIAKRPKVAELEARFPDTFKFFEGTGDDYLNAVQSGSVDPVRFNMVFIDGDHQYESVAKDYAVARKLLGQKGIIAFHDIVDSEHHRNNNCMVSKFWDEVKGKKFLEFKSQDIWAGIGVMSL